MPLRKSEVQKLNAFLDRIKGDVYPEPPSDLHTGITRDILAACLTLCPLPAGARVLDVGCGQGVALALFQQQGFQPVGITLGAVDVDSCRSQGYEVHEMDQSFLDFPDADFDFVWCRHCLEHSIFPYFTLSELYRVLKPGRALYVEVPAPDTSCAHQTNRNHYSVLGESMWLELMKRTGFTIRQTWRIDLRVVAGPDYYWGFLVQKPASM
jgi:SAM-dependent methyltransferase